jgi:hypothetical protein
MFRDSAINANTTSYLHRPTYLQLHLHLQTLHTLHTPDQTKQENAELGWAGEFPVAKPPLVVSPGTVNARFQDSKIFEYRKIVPGPMPRPPCFCLSLRGMSRLGGEKGGWDQVNAMWIWVCLWRHVCVAESMAMRRRHRLNCGLFGVS